MIAAATNRTQGNLADVADLADALEHALGALRPLLAREHELASRAAGELHAIEIVRTQALALMHRSEPDAERLAATAWQLRRAIPRVRRMTGFVETLSRAAEAAPADGRVDLAGSARAHLAALEAEIATFGLKVSADTAAAVARGGRRLVDRAIGELIANAVRHNSPGGWLELSTETRGPRVGLRLANSGPGLDDTPASALVDAFRRADINGDDAHHAHGLGLGLTLVQAIVAGQGGTLAVTASPSGGLVVELELAGAGERRRTQRTARAAA